MSSDPEFIVDHRCLGSVIEPDVERLLASIAKPSTGINKQGEPITHRNPEELFQMVHQPPTLHSRSFLDPVLESLLQPQPYLSPGVDWRVSRLKQFIDAEHGKLGWSLDSVCEQLNLGISGSHGRKLFKKQLGVGIRQYAKRKRLVVAAEKLRATTLSVKEIAFDLGYKKQTDFRRQFAQLFYLSPSGFRSAQLRAAGQNTDILTAEKAPSRTPRLERRGADS